MVNEADKMLTVEDAAKIMGVERRTIYKLINEKRLTAIRATERSTRIPASALEQFMMENLTTKSEEEE